MDNPIIEAMLDHLIAPCILLRVEPVIADLAVIFHFEGDRKERLDDFARDRNGYMAYWKSALTWWDIVRKIRFDPQNPD